MIWLCKCSEIKKDNPNPKKNAHKMGIKIVDRLLQRLFYSVGESVGSSPSHYFTVALFLTALCITGFQRMDYEYDPEYLFSPSPGTAKQERARLEEHFPTDYDKFKSSRMTRVGKFGRLVVSAADGGTMLRTSIWNQLLYLDQVRGKNQMGATVFSGNFSRDYETCL